jgi:DNA polymerase III delta prime subunit
MVVLAYEETDKGMSFAVVSRGAGDLKTRYRPMRLDEMVPTTRIQRLKTIFIDPNAGQVHLFEGPSGTGKTTAARIVARAAVCIDDIANRPCLECVNCLSMDDSSPDFVEINIANFRGIDAVREILESMRYAPVQLNRKIYIFDEVHQLTAPAQQLLLKELEDPAKQMLVFMCTTEMKGLKKTLVDRALTTPFHGVSIEDAKTVISQVIMQEGKLPEDTDETTRLHIIERAEGSVRAVLNNLQLSFEGLVEFGTWSGDTPAEVPALANALMRKSWPEVAKLLRSESIKKAGESTRIGLENYLRAVILKKNTIRETTQAAVPLGHMEGTLGELPKISQYNPLVIRCLRACWASSK